MRSLLLATLPLTSAWPQVMNAMNSNTAPVLNKRIIEPTVPAPLFLTYRDNCGAHGNCTVFNAEDQLVDVSEGSGHEFIAPTSTDLRGQCPGLNAAANHGFLPRSGITNTAQTVEGLGAAYSMSTDLATILSVIAIALSGDPVAGTWSIGSGFPGTLGLLGTPTGIVGTHNRYEGDASIVRGDAYLNDGNVGVFQMDRWERLYSLADVPEGLKHDTVASQAYYTAEYSVLNNPYYFSAPFSGLVAPDAHNFVVNFMSNHSADNFGGVLNTEVLSSFFAVTGTPGNFVHNQGQEQIPANWYKRPTSEAMNTVDTNVDTLLNNGMYPGIIRFGGNTGTTNSFVGVDTNNLTGGVYNGETLLEGNNLACFFLQATMAGLADPLIPFLEPVGELMTFLDDNLAPQISALSCPELAEYNNELFSIYPGASYTGETD